MLRISSILNRLLALAAATCGLVALSACSEEDIVPTQTSHADGVMRLSAKSCGGLLVSAPRQARDGDEAPVAEPTPTTGYNFYDPALHPTTMGGFGFKRRRSSEDTKQWDYVFLENTKTQATTGRDCDLSAGHTFHKYDVNFDQWNYFKADGTTLLTEKWDATNYDYHLFFAYMPYQPGGVGSDGNEHKVKLWQYATQTLALQIPFIPGITHDPYMICHEPKMRVLNLDGTQNDLSRVPFQMDQIMKRYLFRFKLGTEMAELRHFHIEKVEIYGDSLPATATYTRNFIYNVGADDNVTWTFSDGNYQDIILHNIEENNAFQVKRPKWQHHGTTEYYLPLVSTDYRDYGRTYAPINNEGSTPPSYVYVIHTGAMFKPTIKVTYTIFDEKGYQTRQGVGRVVFNWDNFNKVNGDWQDGIAYAHEIKINIVPNRLYILSDADQTQGYLILDE